MRADPSRLSLRRCAAACLLLLVPWVPGAQAAGDAAVPLRVFAAASLADAFGDIARTFESAHPGTRVQLNLAGSQQLATQIEQGAAADVFASADRRWMDYARSRSLVAGEPAAFAGNRLVVVLPRSNPARIERLQDLGRPGVKLVLAADAVPAGRYSRDVVEKLARARDFDPAFSRRALANVVSEEENVKSVLAKVQLGEADAGLVYASDVTPAGARLVRVVDIPESTNVVATYPIAVLRRAPRPETARAFVALVLSPAGQRALARHGLIPVTAPSR